LILNVAVLFIIVTYPDSGDEKSGAIAGVDEGDGVGAGVGEGDGVGAGVGEGDGVGDGVGVCVTV
jgi:hypothetical protein